MFGEIEVLWLDLQVCGTLIRCSKMEVELH